MKRIALNFIIILLCLVVTVPVGVSFLTYHYQLKAIKREVKQELIGQTPRHELVNFSFNTKDASFQNLYWHHSQEFELDGKMFDIVEGDTIGDVVHYLCFPDKQETALNHKFKTQLYDRYAHDAGKQNRSNQICAIFLSLFNEQFCQEIPQLEFIELAMCLDLKTHYVSPYCSPVKPPPKPIV